MGFNSGFKGLIDQFSLSAFVFHEVPQIENTWSIAGERGCGEVDRCVHNHGILGK